MYEHANQLEFGANATAYVAAFMRNIDWAAVLARYEDATNVIPPRPLEQKQFADVPAVTVEEVKAMLALTPATANRRPRVVSRRAAAAIRKAVPRDGITSRPTRWSSARWWRSGRMASNAASLPRRRSFCT